MMRWLPRHVAELPRNVAHMRLAFDFDEIRPGHPGVAAATYSNRNVMC